MPEFKGRVGNSRFLDELIYKIRESDPVVFKKGIECIKLNGGDEVYYPKRDNLKIPLMSGDIVSFVLRRPLSTGVGFFSD